MPIAGWTRIVERTQGTGPLATGAVRGREALVVFAVLMLVAFALVLTLNRLTIYMSGIGILLAASYPYLKRYTYLPQVYLGLAFGWGIPMAFAAVQGEVPAVAWLLYFANVAWATGYDTWYAMVDRDDDLRMGAKSTAILFGELDLVAQGVLYALFFAALALVGQRAGLGSVLLGRGWGRGRCWWCTNSGSVGPGSGQPVTTRSCTTTGSARPCSRGSRWISGCAEGAGVAAVVCRD